MKKILFATILGFFIGGCSTTETPNPNGKNTGGTNYNPTLSFNFKGVSYSASSTSNTYGGKVYLLGLDTDGNLLIDMDLPVQKDETCTAKSFKIENEDSYGNCIFYIDNSQWTLDNGTLDVTKHENNRVSGSFSGEAHKMDYSQSPPAKLESSTEFSGVFTDLEVK
ncbi:MAG: hypothetical protein KJP21_01080 [Bacteroidia bacterium]|nr:hypothetical protein [Bacteroidia bacterium]NNJ55715.1 hypothetical protein [Bacteroidia bacterium]